MTTDIVNRDPHERPAPGPWPLPTATVELNVLQIGYLNAFVWERLDRCPGDPIPRALFTLLKDAAIRLGVDWYYGELPELPAKEDT